MFRFIAEYYFKRTLKKINGFGTVSSKNWPEYKALCLDLLKYSTKVDTNCNDDILYWNMASSFQRNKHLIEGNIPADCYADLEATLELMRKQHNPDLWEKVNSIDRT